VRKKTGFTLIEVLVTLAVVAIIVPMGLMTAQRFYLYSRKMTTINEIKQSARRIMVKIQRDIHVNGNCTPRQDNHGISISTPEGATTYYLREGALYRSGRSRTVRLSTFPVEDATFIMHGNALTVNLVMSHYNINTKKTATYKSMESMEL
jgi:prepilin-type N-terminal cleavage/methylation domain-containing protein